jgi:hypothetical protein
VRRGGLHGPGYNRTLRCTRHADLLSVSLSGSCPRAATPGWQLPEATDALRSLPPQRSPAPHTAAWRAAMSKAGASVVGCLHRRRPFSLPAGCNPGRAAERFDSIAEPSSPEPEQRHP